MKYAYTNMKLLNGHKDMVIEEGKVVLVEDSKIVDITSSDANLDGYKVIDLGGKYMMPGLINMHVHVPGSGKASMKQSDTKKTVKLMTSNGLTKSVLMSLCKSYVKMELMSGVTTLRAVGGVQDFDSRLRDLIKEGKADGPRMLVANEAVSVPGGHMAGSLAVEAQSAEDARYWVGEIAKTNPDIIKLMITGGVLDAKKKGEPGELKMPLSYVKAACEEAHKLGFMVAAHVESPEGVKVALEGGVDTIEHGARLDDELVELFKKTGAKIIATISPAVPFAFFDQKETGLSDIDAFNGKFLYEAEIDCYKRAIEERIPLGLGTDVGCPFITHYDTWRELLYFVKCLGVTPEYALYTATLKNAVIAGIDNITGSIDIGKDADFVMTEKNPLEDMKALKDISMVVARGKIYDHPQVKKKDVVEQALNKFC